MAAAATWERSAVNRRRVNRVPPRKRWMHSWSGAKQWAECSMHVSYGRCYSIWAGSSSRSTSTEFFGPGARDRFAMDDAYQRHERGEIDASQYFAYLPAMLELSASDDEIAAGWNTVMCGIFRKLCGTSRGHSESCRALPSRIPTRRTTPPGPRSARMWTPRLSESLFPPHTPPREFEQGRYGKAKASHSPS